MVYTGERPINYRKGEKNLYCTKKGGGGGGDYTANNNITYP